MYMVKILWLVRKNAKQILYLTEQWKVGQID